MERRERPDIDTVREVLREEDENAEPPPRDDADDAESDEDES